MTLPKMLSPKRLRTVNQDSDDKIDRTMIIAIVTVIVIATVIVNIRNRRHVTSAAAYAADYACSDPDHCLNWGIEGT